jgi:hypothetical protein
MGTFRALNFPGPPPVKHNKCIVCLFVYFPGVTTLLVVFSTAP